MEFDEHAPVVFQTKGLAEPTFIVELEGKYYLTLGVWEYDPHAPNLNEEQRFQINHLIEVFHQHRARGAVHQAVYTPYLAQTNGGSTGRNTQPTNPGNGPPGPGAPGRN